MDRRHLVALVSTALDTSTMGDLRFSRFGRAPQFGALPFLTFGLALAVWAPPLILAESPNEDVTLLHWVGWGIATFAIVLGSLRGAITIDVASGEVVTWWGFGVPWRRKRVPLDRFDRITIEREAPGETGMRHIYPVFLRGARDSVRLLGGTRERDRSRRFADRVSAQLGLSVEDASHG